MFKHLNTRIPKRIEQEKDKVSAVLIPLIKKNDGYHILFEVRSNKLSQQPGEICFPGQSYILLDLLLLHSFL